MQELQRMSPVKRRTEQVPTYRALIKVTAQVVDNGRALLKVTKAAPLAQAPARREIERLSEQLEHYIALADRVVSQARRRVLEGEQVSAQEKLYSLFEPHTDLIKRGKTNTPVEFGHKVLLAESRRGLITDYQILDGNPPDELQVAPSLQRHRQQFGKVPKLYAGDRGFYSAPNVTLLSTAGVEESIPQRGGRKTPPARSLREKPALQARSEVSGWNRRTHQRARSRPGHEALPAAGPRRIRSAGRCSRARQQPSGHCSLFQT
jgi:transposase, IS5 family